MAYDDELLKLQGPRLRGLTGTWRSKAQEEAFDPRQLIPKVGLDPIPPLHNIIVFERWDTYGHDQIWSMYPDGSNAVNISNSQTFDGDPCISPDRSHIVFHRGILPGTYGIYKMAFDGSGQVGLTPPAPGTLGDLAPCWSPDASKIAFSRNSQIWVMSASGTGAH